MAKRSRMAHLLQALVAALFGSAIAWFAWHWPAQPVRAATGALAILFSYTIVLALQCLLLGVVSRGDSAPRPSFAELVRAWWGEVCDMPAVFYWRIPFRWREWPDQLGPETHGRVGYVFVHGFVCNRALWHPWLARLKGHAFVAVNLEPVFGSIDEYAPLIDAAVREVARASGRAPVVVCHSMGGLAARAWLRTKSDAIVERVVTIGSPHHGTWLGRFGHTRNGRQMRWQSAWLRELASDEARRTLPPFTCWYSHCDNIVFPTSSAMLPHADNRLVRGPAHVELAFDPQVMDATLPARM
jgi:triacylglycerol lipase